MNENENEFEYEDQYEYRDELTAELAAANPYSESAMASAVPAGTENAFLREITASEHRSFKQRIGRLIDDALSTPAWSRAGFVGVLAVVALAIFAIRPGSPDSGQEVADDVAVPAGTLEVPAANESSDDGEAETPKATTATTDQLTAGSDGADTTSSEDLDETPPSILNDQETDGAESGTQPSGSSPTPDSNTGQTPATGAACISIEAEHLQLTGAWSQQGGGDASGGSFIVWKGLAFERNNNAPADVISTEFTVSSPGSYHFAWAMRQPSDVAGDRANDSWVNFPDAARFGPVGGGSYGGFVKVFGNATGNFGWMAIADQNEQQSEIAVEFNEAGTYTMQLAGRSHGHEIDRIVLHRNSVSLANAIAGNCDGQSPSKPDPIADPVVVASGPFDPSRDLISLHHDHAPGLDDGHATVAGRVVTDAYGLTPWVVSGAYGANAEVYQQGSEAVMYATWGSEWVNADRDWNGAVLATADRWQEALNNGGRIWVAEGGQSNLTAEVVRELERRMPALDTRARINVVQHSRWNEEQTDATDLRYVQTIVNYIQIEDGNVSNATADLNTVTPGWEQRARNSRWASAWAAAFDYLNPDERLDFSDTVELLHILGIPKAEIGTTSDFADRYFG